MSANILIVDDSLTVRMDLAEAFEAAGFRPLPCGTLARAREILAGERIDVLILDVVLPDDDGVALLMEVRSSSNSSLPVILLSKETEVRDRIRGMTKGADEYVGKPYDASYLIARVRKLLQKQPARRPDQKPVLLIDDSATFRARLREALEADGYSVTTAASGEEGLRLAGTTLPSAIIVDGVLPGIDGATVIRRIRLDAALRRVPCVLLTADADIDAELRALDSGADAFVQKGDDLAEVLVKLGAVLRTSPAVEEEEANTESLASPKKILVVDDSPTFLQEVSVALRTDGYDVIQARSGEEAIELLAVEPVECVLLDLVMPGMGGRETCRCIKNSPTLRDVPVLILTSVGGRDSMLQELATGADDYIQKTSEFEVLKARIRAQLRRRQFEEETRRVRERLLRSELEAAEARAQRELAEMRAALVDELERKNRELSIAYREQQATQSKLIQAAKMASLGELVAGVAHEINNPLAFVISHLETARRSLDLVREGLKGSLPPALALHERRADERLREMGIGLSRIRELVVKLRTFSRLDEGEYKLVSVRECIESVLMILGHRIQDRIALELSFGDPDEIECYSGLLNQALMNLLANAVDAIDGPGTIGVSTGAAGGEYSISVSDSGKGIPESLRERVFEPFFTTKPVGQGTGLGLSITYSIVQKHGGTLELAPRDGGGTVATIRLPLTRARPSRALPAP